MNKTKCRTDKAEAPAASKELSGMDRRNFLITSAVAGFVAASGAGLGMSRAMAATADGVAGFGTISAFVTRQKGFDPKLVERAYDQLVELDPSFDTKVVALSDAIKSADVEDIDAFLATSPDQDLRETMTTITAVWYLGYTGTPDPSQEKDDAKFVTYRDALMWKPTGNTTPIPTYSQHKQNYWAEPPTADDIK
ncbi:sugar dehydrogenase complex small subunit [Thioclava kandeliae]|uniref:Sugar dehydrogenase complex small subunit n=1 Tax=Thioclava kandeliae TaxID=3070818 RepID=A0ABV1SIK4_9RHOB